MLAVLQFDSTSVPVVERMLAEGRLPTLYSGVEIAEARLRTPS